MCARYSLTKDGLVVQIGEFEVVITFGSRINISPGQKVQAIIAGEREPQAIVCDWGWHRRDGGLLVNAKSENLNTLFSNSKRCLIPADGFYEWTSDKIPIRFSLPEDRPFCFAGLWRVEKSKPADEVITTNHLVIITRPPEEPVSKFHDRMPFVVQPQHYNWWLGAGQLFNSVIEFPDREKFNYCPVQPALNKSGTEGMELLRPYIKPQQELF